jgi:hypothetical protein
MPAPRRLAFHPGRCQALAPNRVRGEPSAASLPACWRARPAITLRPMARASSVSLVRRFPPSLTPRAFAAASAALVRVEIIPASSSATDAICCSMNRPVGPSIVGRSANRTSTPALPNGLPQPGGMKGDATCGSACHRCYPRWLHYAVFPSPNRLAAMPLGRGEICLLQFIRSPQ